MNTFKSFVCFAVLAAGLIWIPGCGSAADENKPMADVKSEAQSMDADDLRSMAMSYKEAIEKKISEMDGITEQLKEIPITQQLGEEAKTLQNEIEAITESIEALKDRFAVYYDKLKELDGDLSGLKM